MIKTQYISLECLAATLALPKKYLRNLVKNSQIPVLNVNGRLRFNFEDVRQALTELAAKNNNNKNANRKTRIDVAKAKPL